MTESFQRVFRSTQEEVTETIQSLEKWMAMEQFDEETSMELAIILAESLNNVVEHAYEYRKNGRITVEVALRTHSLVISIEDEGKPLASIPGGMSQDDRLARSKKLPEGGFGWMLIHELSDSVEHIRKCGVNKLKIKICANKTPNFR